MKFGQQARVDIKHLRESLRDANRAVRDLDAERVQLQRRLEQMRKDQAASHEQLEDLRAAFRLAGDERDHYRAGYPELQTKITALGMELHAAHMTLEQRYQQLRQVIDQVHAKDDEITSLREECSELTQSVQEFEIRLAAAEQETRDEKQAWSDTFDEAEKESRDDILAMGRMFKAKIAVGRTMSVLSSTDDHS